ncbi:MAG: histidinol-phosphate transaminase [Halobacteriales archaeon]
MRPRDLSDNVEYRAGRGIEEVARDRGLDPENLVKLASNENPYGTSPKAADAIRATADRAHAYPKTSHVDLTAAIADHWGVDSEQVWLAAGADGALDYLARAALEPSDRVLVPTPGFAYYPMSARYHHGQVREYPLRKAEEFALTSGAVLAPYEDERIVYLTTPHNPTGAWIDLEGIEDITRSVESDTLLVVDEAYGEFSDVPSAVSLLDTYDNIAVTRTFSKAYGLAGLRLGYAVVPSSWADAYAKVNTPFAANEVACRAGLAALEDDEHVERTVETADWAREYIHEELDAPTWESHGNFVLADVGDAAAVSDALEARGVIVRDCTSFGLPACVRITCGSEADTKRAVSEANGVLAER